MPLPPRKPLDCPYCYEKGIVAATEWLTKRHIFRLCLTCRLTFEPFLLTSDAEHQHYNTHRE
jgi:hypothetical protein